MTPAARLAAAIEVLDQWEAGEERAEKLLRAWGRANRYAGSKDRRAIADLIYDCLRRKRSLAWASGAKGGRGLIHGLSLAEDWNVDELFSGAGYGPSPLTDEERTPQSTPPAAVALDHPDWLEERLHSSLGADYEAAMTALSGRAPVDLRVNLLRTDAAGAAAALADDGVTVEPIEGLEGGLRAQPGARISASAAYQSGLIELQDASSQRAVLIADPQPGETVLDYCAGGGGKTLAIASHTRGNAKVIAHDADTARLYQTRVRAERAAA
ncbi:MAG: RsmB/NOP family class I SAM-dependent RNA methyltransferase, partial [Pseudomonadota bacterium]